MRGEDDLEMCQAQLEGIVASAPIPSGIHTCDDGWTACSSTHCSTIYSGEVEVELPREGGGREGSTNHGPFGCVCPLLQGGENERETQG